jgi:hypothetical protein
MRTHNFYGTALILGLTLSTALMIAPTAYAQTYSSYQLRKIEWLTMRGGWANAQQGGFQVLGAEANSREGFYHVRSLVNGCEWKFSWNFSKDGAPADVTQISYSRGELAIGFRIESSGGVCSSRDVNPFIEFHADGDPTALVYGPNEEYKGRFCLQAGGNCNQRSPYRKFKIYRQTSVKDGALFEINLFLPAYPGYGQHAQSIIYRYQGQSGDSGSVRRRTELVSGSYQVQVRNSGTIHRAVWRLQVSGNQITGSSDWGTRVDPVQGYIQGNSVVIQRDCRGQGFTGECRQVYQGIIGNGVIQGSFSGTGAAPGNVWTLNLSSR